ncbi:F0F1 ATP synthase subunit B [Ferrovum myxofaciens]|jgi:F-type H+-transporting ATPase subunit b|uniref:ATP synthase subunit b n=3 Tax=root TaxID=1 RepID=A0A8F3DVL1_9PROT|nr:F0F1 ATP synthase subunit B [Ferrovum myxofaciens]KXW58724.1 ATP synthase subunit b [Ferrovum myxofaciens]MBU6994951.1 F0F1 ATP synthase subunit B [Ferrovum myxofaciens]QKE38757.1 MAG: F0F1 ATP synthase subunit B [Ferrovum myxofaciens]QKE41321.1 MAG: F0F1 ATP synthase subunit B [Ferrovum myxofaciens]QWY73963.1 MAG: F0F1 ATP synthase subunit B [Ferrovum myxofaciens]
MNINATLFGQAITFAILIWFTMKFVWPPVVAALDERSKRISEGLEAAERGRQDYAKAELRSQDALNEAKARASEIIALSEKQAQIIVQQAHDAAVIEANRVKAQAQAEVEQEVMRARDSLRDRVADLAVSGAEKILRREINVQAHADLLTAIQAEL